jgi:hypothetical protein
MSRPFVMIAVVAATAAALGAGPVSVASARCNRQVTDPRGPGGVLIATYRRVSCQGARRLGRSYLLHPARRPSLHYGFHCRPTAKQAGGGELRCTKTGGKLVLLDFE